MLQSNQFLFYCNEINHKIDEVFDFIVLYDKSNKYYYLYGNKRNKEYNDIEYSPFYIKLKKRKRIIKFIKSLINNKSKIDISLYHFQYESIRNINYDKIEYNELINKITYSTDKGLYYDDKLEVISYDNIKIKKNKKTIKHMLENLKY